MKKLQELEIRVAQLEKQSAAVSGSVHWVRNPDYLPDFGFGNDNLHSSRVADLDPPLGSEADPCFILERAKNNGASIAEVQYVKEVLEDLPLVDHEESGRRGLADIPRSDKNKFYRLTYKRRERERVNFEPITFGKKKRKMDVNITGFTLSKHAQFRMDLRGITVRQVEDVLRNWQKTHRVKAEELKQKAMKNREDHDRLLSDLDAFGNMLSYEERMGQFEVLREYHKGMEINHKFNNVFVGFVPQRDGTVDIKTVFNLKREDETFNC